MMRKARVIVLLAFRNLRRYLRRSLLTALALVLGGALLMISLPLNDGTHEAWIASGVRMGSGHLSIQTPEFQASRKLEDRLSQPARSEAEAVLRSAEIASLLLAVSPRLSVNGLASSPAGARPAQILGVDPAAEAEFTILDEKVIEGRYLAPRDRLAAYVGSVLVESLELRLGSRLVVAAQDASGEIAGQLVRVVGVFRTGVPEIDGSLVHVPLTTAGSWLGTGGEVTQIAVLVARSDDVEPLERAFGLTTWKGWELSGWGGVLYDGAAGAFAASGSFGAWALRGEGELRGRDGGAVFRGSVGVDRRFGISRRDLILVVEYQRDGFGASTPEDYPEVLRSNPFLRGELQVLGRDETAMQVSYRAHPLFRLGGFALVNLGDGSALLSPSFAFSASDQATVSGGIFLGLGKAALGDGGAPLSEYGLVPTSAYLSVSWFF
jgi:hypothetical protein